MWPADVRMDGPLIDRTLPLGSIGLHAGCHAATYPFSRHLSLDSNATSPLYMYFSYSRTSVCPHGGIFTLPGNSSETRYKATIHVALSDLYRANAMHSAVLVIVNLSVRHTRGLDCVHIVRPTITISSPYGSTMVLVFADTRFTEIRSKSPRARALRVG